MMSRLATLGAATAMLMTATGCASDDSTSPAQTVTTIEQPSAVTNTTATSTFTEPDSAGSTLETAAEPGELVVRWVNPPLFATPGSTLALTFDADVDSTADLTVASTPELLATPPVFDSASDEWTAIVDIPATLNERSLLFTVKAADATSEALVVAVVSDTTPIKAATVSDGSSVFVELPWGTDIGEVGRVLPEGEGETFLPMSLDVDPRDGSVIVLDSPNERLVVVGSQGTPTGTIALPVPEGWYVQDVIVMGTTGRAAVIAYPSSGEPRLGVLDVNLDTGEVNYDDPLAVPAFANNNPMFWNPYAETVTARILGQDFSFYDASTSAFVEPLTSAEWFDAIRQDDPPAAGITDDNVSVVVATADDPTIVDARFPFDGTFWQIVTTIDFEIEPPVSTSLLQRVTPAMHRAVSTAIDFSFTDSFSRRLAVSGDAAFVAVPTDTGFRIDRHELPG